MAKKNQFTEEDDELLAQLGVEVESKKAQTHTAREERIIAGFEEIQKFVEAHGRLPEHGEDKDIFERLYAVRLDRIRAQKECMELLKNHDPQNLLSARQSSDLLIPDELNDDELLSALGVDTDRDTSITRLTHIKSRADKRAAEEIANRSPCEDFEQFKPLFERVQKELDAGIRETIRFRKDAGFTKTQLKKAQFLIVGGQVAYIAEVGETIKAPNGEDDARLRVIYSNGMESNILLRSLIRAMYKDETSRFITDPKPVGLFADQISEGDIASGLIYVLRSHSNHPTIQANREVIHKIVVTGGEVKTRIANAKKDPTFLLAEVEVVATYQLANINRFKLEKLIHNVLEPAKLEIEITDRFGHPVKVREWYLAPLFIIDEVVDRIRDGSIEGYYYDVGGVRLEGG